MFNFTNNIYFFYFTYQSEIQLNPVDITVVYVKQARTF